MKRFFKILLWCLLAAIFVGTFYFLWKNSHKEPEHYNTVHAGVLDISRTTVLTGKIEPRDEVAVKPQISGIISEISVEAGDHVNAGDIIAHIQVVPDASQLSSAYSRLETARIELRNITNKWQRDSSLYAMRVISREEYEQSLTDLDKARSEVDAADDALTIVRQGVSRHNSSTSNTLVRSTVTGIVLDVPVKVGTSVIQANTFNDGTTIATVADMTKLIFKGNVDETEVGFLRTGMPMTISIGALPQYSPQAVIEYIAPKGTDNNGANTYEIKGAIDATAIEGLRAGYSANATVSLAAATGVLALPESTVEFVGDSTFVYVLRDTAATEQTFDRIAVVTGISDGINIEIKEGIDSTASIREALIR